MTFALLDTRNLLVKALKDQGFDIRGAGMFIVKDRYEADMCVTAPSGEEYHIVVWPSKPGVATPVDGMEYGPDTKVT